MSETHVTRRLASVLLLSGAVLLLVGNTTHPVDAESSMTSRLELAVAGSWVPIHLAIAAGVLAVVGGLAVLSPLFRQPRAAAYARLGMVAAIIGGAALALVFGALDGYGQAALGAEWQATSGVDREALEAVAVALDVIDSGMTALGILAFFGAGMLAFGAAIVGGRVVSDWLGWVALAIGSLGVVTGTLFAVLGSTPLVINGLFRPLAMAATVYFVVLAVALRRPARERGRAVPA
jgi:hypothetical protein